MNYFYCQKRCVHFANRLCKVSCVQLTLSHKKGRFQARLDNVPVLYPCFIHAVGIKSSVDALRGGDDMMMAVEEEERNWPEIWFSACCPTEIIISYTYSKGRDSDCDLGLGLGEIPCIQPTWLEMELKLLFLFIYPCLEFWFRLTDPIRLGVSDPGYVIVISFFISFYKVLILHACFWYIVHLIATINIKRGTISEGNKYKASIDEKGGRISKRYRNREISGGGSHKQSVACKRWQMGKAEKNQQGFLYIANTEFDVLQIQ